MVVNCHVLHRNRKLNPLAEEEFHSPPIKDDLRQIGKTVSNYVNLRSSSPFSRDPSSPAVNIMTTNNRETSFELHSCLLLVHSSISSSDTRTFATVR